MTSLILTTQRWSLPGSFSSYDVIMRACISVTSYWITWARDRSRRSPGGVWCREEQGEGDWGCGPGRWQVWTGDPYTYLDQSNKGHFNNKTYKVIVSLNNTLSTKTYKVIVSLNNTLSTKTYKVIVSLNNTLSTKAYKVIVSLNNTLSTKTHNVITSLNNTLSTKTYKVI